MVTLVDVKNPKEVAQDNLKKDIRDRLSLTKQSVSDSKTKAPISLATHGNIITYYNNVVNQFITSFNIRQVMQLRDLAYYRKNDNTRAQALASTYNQVGQADKIQNTTIPIVMPQVESALAYHAGVFLTGYPIFSTVAPPEQADAIGQMDAIISDNQTRGAWPMHLLKTIRNGLKYDLGAVEVTWETKKNNRVGTPQIDKLTQGSVDEVIWQGNVIRDLDPYNLLLDTRVSPEENYLYGELAGYTKLMNTVAMRQAMDELDPLYTFNYDKAFDSPSTGVDVNGNNASYFIPSINPDALLPPSQNNAFNWTNFLSGRQGSSGRSTSINYQSAYEWAVIYVRLIPEIFGLRSKDAKRVEIWKFIIINKAVVIFAQKQDNAHNFLPIIVCKPSNDGLGWQSASFAQNAEPYQYVASALVNSAIESQRRKVYDRIFYDPNRVAKKDIDNVSSVARIPVKNSQYNKDIASAIHISPYRDEGISEILAFSQNVTQMADVAVGQNRVQQGQFQKGNKTRREFDTTMSNANSRQQMSAIGLEYSFFTPIKEIIKSNILQYQPPTTIVNANTSQPVAVDPTVLRKAIISFKISDGLLPTEKLVNGELFTVLMQSAQAIPELRAEYDIMGIFNYQMELQGADWLKSFKRSPEEANQYMKMMTQASLAAGNAKPQNPETPPQSQT